MRVLRQTLVQPPVGPLAVLALLLAAASLAISLAGPLVALVLVLSLVAVLLVLLAIPAGSRSQPGPATPARDPADLDLPKPEIPGGGSQ